MNSKTILLLSILITLSGFEPRLDAGQIVNSSDVGVNVIVVGKLGKALGTPMTIEGDGVSAEPVKTKSSSMVVALRVTKVNDKTLETPLIIGISTLAGSAVQLPKMGEHRTFRGWEYGTFIGTPESVQSEVGPEASTQKWRFATTFRVFK